ncbi:hypothetical protein COO60DRAFT_1699417 [Scenedesmus sp. NREL 46B-D3]|nr:hypothetical protein COO60DRAFT_1699417 [Scenedesmus sp. NREL 46B-D3]
MRRTTRFWRELCAGAAGQGPAAACRHPLALHRPPAVQQGQALLEGVPGLACVQTVDSSKLADRLNRIAAGLSRPQKLGVMLQVNTSGEASKYGCAPAEAVGLARHIAGCCESLQLAGLMTIGMPDYSSRPENFSCLVECRAEVAAALGLAADELQLSMGMSGDFEQAIEMGSTNVRAIMQQLRAAWPGHSYDLLTRNCCHFCEQLAGQLGVGPVPGWLNRFAVGAAATVSMTQETVKTVQEVGQELGRLSAESLSFLKASWQKTLAAASQQQQQLSERLQQQQQGLRQQRELQGAAGSPDAAAAAGAGSRSTPQMHAPAGFEAEAWDAQQRLQHRSASETCIADAHSSNSTRAAPAWLPGSGGGGAAIAAGAASAGQNLLAGFQQGGRQLKALTSRLGSRLMQQQQQHNPAAVASLQDAAAGRGQGQASSAWQQQQQQQQPQYPGMSPGDYLQPRTVGQQEWQLPPVQQQHQQQPLSSGAIPAVQPKLAPQFCVDGPDAVADPLASLLLDDADVVSASDSNRSIGVAAAGSSQAAGGTGEGQPLQATALPAQAPAAQHVDLLS